MPRSRWVPVALAALALIGSAVAVSAQQQPSGVAQEVLARGRAADAEAVNGPADVYIGSIQLLPGATYAGWHTHPGPVWVVVTAGDLAVYGPDGCRTTQPTGSAYLAEPDTAYDLRNEGTQPTVLFFSGVIPAGQPPTIQAAAPAACGS
jgi:quercetin dioxygenase-like cupin family protein